MPSILAYLKDVLKGKHPRKAKRSSQWSRVRNVYLHRNPTCAVCGGSKKLQVHHIKPFYMFPHLELDPNNLITLCEAGKYGIKCHQLMGHLGNFRLFNENVREDAAIWNKKFANAKDSYKLMKEFEELFEKSGIDFPDD